MNVSRELVCDILQRYYGKKMSGKYRYPHQLYESIASEIGSNVQFVEMVIDINTN